MVLTKYDFTKLSPDLVVNFGDPAWNNHLGGCWQEVQSDDENNGYRWISGDAWFCLPESFAGKKILLRIECIPHLNLLGGKALSFTFLNGAGSDAVTKCVAGENVTIPSVDGYVKAESVRQTTMRVMNADYSDEQALVFEADSSNDVMFREFMLEVPGGLPMPVLHFVPGPESLIPEKGCSRILGFAMYKLSLVIVG